MDVRLREGDDRQALALEFDRRLAEPPRVEGDLAHVVEVGELVFGLDAERPFEPTSDAIELLRDPSNLKELSDGASTRALAVKSDQVVQLLRRRGADSRQEAIALIRQAARALGGDEVIVQRQSALRVDEFGSGPSQAMPAFWVPVSSGD